MFDKNGVERKMFADFYKMCEEYWTPDGSDDYWNAVVKASDEFNDKYVKDIPLVTSLVVALVTDLERKFEEMKNG